MTFTPAMALDGSASQAEEAKAKILYKNKVNNKVDEVK